MVAWSMVCRYAGFLGFAAGVSLVALAADGALGPALTVVVVVDLVARALPFAVVVLGLAAWILSR